MGGMGAEADSWKVGYQRALIDTIIRKGSPHDPDKDPFWGSSLPDDWQECRTRALAVGIDYPATSPPVESFWYEFQGTFYEGDRRKYGVDVEVRLLDGTTQWYRYSGSVSDLILEIVR